MENEEDPRERLKQLIKLDMDLNKRMENYRQIIENYTDLIVEVDMEGRILFVSPSYCDVFGKTQNELIGGEYMPLVHEEDKETTRQEMEKLSLPPHSCYVEQRALTKKGWRWFGWADKAIMDENDNISAIVSVGRDITEKKTMENDLQKNREHLEKVVKERTHSLMVANNQLKTEIAERVHVEKALRESQTQYNMILNGISDLVILMLVEPGNSYRIVNISKSCCNVLNLCKNTAIGKLIDEVVDIKALNAIKEAGKQAFEKGFTVNTLVTNTDRDFDTNIIPLLDRNGDCTHIIFVGRDITEKRKTEEHIMKIEKLESVGLLAGGIAHDFNNILTAVIGNISLIKAKLNRHTFDENNMMGLIGQVEKASLQAKDLTQQLLTFAKGGNPILKTVPIGELVRESAEFSLRGSNVKCQFKLPADLWHVKIDQGQFNQVINNMIINADHAMKGGGTVIVRAKNIYLETGDSVLLESGKYVQLSIQDFGEGIPKPNLKRIFDPYFTTKEMGSGLGLTTTYSIVRKHGGDIIVESQEKIGTIFHIILPASEIETVKKSKKKPAYSRGKGRILVMDDEKMVRYVVCEMLTHLGYEVSSAKDGDEAILHYTSAKQKGNPYDVVIMDLTIPGGMGGKEAIEKLSKMDPEVKAIVSSGYSNDPVMANYQQYGFKAVVTKPFSIEELGEVLQGVLLDNENHTRVS